LGFCEGQLFIVKVNTSDRESEQDEFMRLEKGDIIVREILRSSIFLTVACQSSISMGHSALVSKIIFRVQVFLVAR